MKLYLQPIITLSCFTQNDILIASENEKNDYDTLLDFGDISDNL